MSAFKKSLLVAGVAMILSNNVFADEGHGIVKYKGTGINKEKLLKACEKFYLVSFMSDNFIKPFKTLKPWG